MADQKFYDQVARELAAQQFNEGLWVRAFSEANGDGAKAKAAYIGLRVKQLAVEEQEQQQAAKSSAAGQQHQPQSKMERLKGRLLNYLDDHLNYDNQEAHDNWLKKQLHQRGCDFFAPKRLSDELPVTDAQLRLIKHLGSKVALPLVLSLGTRQAAALIDYLLALRAKIDSPHHCWETAIKLQNQTVRTALRAKRNKEAQMKELDSPEHADETGQQGFRVKVFMGADGKEHLVREFSETTASKRKRLNAEVRQARKAAKLNKVVAKKMRRADLKTIKLYARAYMLALAKFHKLENRDVSDGLLSPIEPRFGEWVIRANA